jgi:SAM domain (Sterile alpha motif)
LFRLADHRSPAANRTPSWISGGWLRSLGLERYEAAFRENEIDGTVLPSLTAEDLKELGDELAA